jgi:hypothetical protein
MDIVQKTLSVFNSPSPVGRGWGEDNLLLRILPFVFLVFLTSCQPEPPTPLQTTFYHWETILSPDSTGRKLLKDYACDKLYVKAFDVSWEGGRPKPEAWVEMKDTVGLPDLIPVVFITNEVFINLSEDGLLDLAEDIVGLVDDLFPAGFAELQIDCDWTARTQGQYFSFLSKVKKLRLNIMLSCTVRLHQYRDRGTQGVPPVDRATLMAYNTGDLNRWETENSIYDSTVVKNYLANQPDYPLDLDLAVAAYDWAAVYRRGELAYLINEPDLETLGDTAHFSLKISSTATRYYVNQSTYLDGLYLYAGDQIRREVVLPSTIPEQAKVLRYYVKSFPGQRLMIYRLGSRVWE